MHIWKIFGNQTNLLTLVFVLLLIVSLSEGVRRKHGFRPYSPYRGNFGPRSFNNVQGLQNPNTNCPPSDPNHNKRVIQNYYQLVIGDKVSDRAVLSQLVHEDLIQHSPIVEDGLSGLIKAINTIFQTIPNFKVVFNQLFSDGDYVMTHLTIPNGDIVNAVMDIYRFECGKIKEHWDVLQDMASVVPVNSHPFF